MKNDRSNIWAVKEYCKAGSFIGATYFNTSKDAHKLYDKIYKLGEVLVEVTFISHGDSGKIYEIAADEDETDG